MSSFRVSSICSVPPAAPAPAPSPGGVVKRCLCMIVAAERLSLLAVSKDGQVRNLFQNNSPPKLGNQLCIIRSTSSFLIWFYDCCIFVFYDPTTYKSFSAGATHKISFESQAQRVDFWIPINWRRNKFWRTPNILSLSWERISMEYIYYVFK